MTGFEKSNWEQSEYSQEYLNDADNYLQERTTLLRILASFYRNFASVGGAKRILDLGCGDGVIAETLYSQDKGMEIVVTDGSRDMLEAAKVRLTGLPVSEFCHMTFEEMIAGKFTRTPFDFIASAFAIHHLELAHKTRLFKRIIELLKPGAYFLNLDVVLSEHTTYTDWYYRLWEEWITNRQQCLGLKESLAHVPEQARTKPENHYDTLQSQLNALSAVGFKEVECHYRYGLFSIYGGRKPLAA